MQANTQHVLFYSVSFQCTCTKIHSCIKFLEEEYALYGKFDCKYSMLKCNFIFMKPVYMFCTDIKFSFDLGMWSHPSGMTPP